MDSKMVPGRKLDHLRKLSTFVGRVEARAFSRHKFVNACVCKCLKGKSNPGVYMAY